jgi:hypothetical protein
MDPRLVRLYEQGDADDEVAAILRLSSLGAVPDGVRLVTKFGDIATVRLRRGDIPTVRGAERVASMKAVRPLYREAARTRTSSTGNIVATLGDERRPRTEQATGRGVVIAVIDWGLDFAHPDIRYSDGRTRLLALWDQSADSDHTTPPLWLREGLPHWIDQRGPLFRRSIRFARVPPLR